MAEKQRGRPKRTPNAKTNEVGQDQKAKENPNLEEKIIEVTTKPKETKQPPKIRPSQRNRGLHTIIVRGKERQATKATYDALKKDPKLKVVLPEGSLLVEPDLNKPCKDC